MKKFSFLFIVLFLFLTCDRIPELFPVQNIILMIGDGMGPVQIYAAMTASHGTLAIERCTNIGMQKTYSANNYITDSGAAGTALACGVKTNNGSIGVDPQGLAVKSILEYAESHGLSSGLVSTSAITHATPASFIAHQKKRGDYEAIAADFLKTDINIFIGGGRDHFSKREDQLNLLDSLKNRGYQVATEISGIQFDQERVACLTADVHNPSMLNGRGNMFPDAVSTAIRFLNKNKNGFFLMAEGSQIDWEAHDNNLPGVVAEVQDFDRAVGIALDFASENGNTLVIVTGDHETGGMTLKGGDIKSGALEAAFSTEDHTAVMIPVYTFGQGSEKFSGIFENTDIFLKMMDAFGFN